MSQPSPRLGVGLPDQFEEPYFQTGRNRDLAWDAGVFANAENSQLQFLGGGTVGWDSTAAPPSSGVLFWTEDIQVTGFSTPFKAVIAGGVSAELADSEVLFFTMPRLLRADFTVQLFRANRIFLQGTRIHDLRLFAARIGTKVYFYNGKSILDGQQGVLFGGGLFPTSIIPIHTHDPTLIIEPPSAGVSVLDVLSTSPDLIRVDLFRNGLIQAEGALRDYTIVLSTGLITLNVPTVSSSERFVIHREIRDLVSPTTNHTHLTPLITTPPPATVLLDMLVTAPVLEDVILFRNGALLSDPADYSLDLLTGFITLVVPSIALDVYISHRRIMAP